jgi:hypothetical protein
LPSSSSLGSRKADRPNCKKGTVCDVKVGSSCATMGPRTMAKLQPSWNMLHTQPRVANMDARTAYQPWGKARQGQQQQGICDTEKG